MSTTHHQLTGAPDQVPASSMYAIVQDRWGSPDVLEHRQVSRPTPGPGQVLIEVHAAGVDRGTWHLMTGKPYLIRAMGYGFARPKVPTPGLDVAGRVAAVGPGVTRLAPGDRVFGIGIGTLAQYAVAEEAKLVALPPSVTMEQAGVAAVSGITALQALTDVGRVEAGQRVLIVGASGGVGSFAVQIAKAYGCEVTGVASGRNLDLVRSLGADHVVDYSTEDVTEGDARYDLVVDIGGRNPVSRLRRVLVSDGTLVMVGGEGGGALTGGIERQIGAAILSRFVSQRLTFFVSAEDGSSIERLADLLADGRVVPAVGARYPLAEAAGALRDMEAGRTRGKSVIVVRDDQG